MEIEFSIKTKHGNYNDTLFFPDGVTPTEEEIKQLKEARVRRWVQTITSMKGATALGQRTPAPAIPAEILEMRARLFNEREE